MATRSDILRLCDRFALPSGLTFILLLTVRMHVKIYPHYEGWFAGFDQGKYLLAARAWARGDFDPAAHYYPPGYSLLAAPFVWLLPAQPFAIPDAVCLAASFVGFLYVAHRLTQAGPQGAAPGWRAAAAAVFCVSTLATPTLRQIWVVPWNSTAAAPVAIGAVWATLRLCEHWSWRRAACVGLLIGGLAGIRPTDALIVAPPCAVYAIWVRVLGREERHGLLLAAVAGIGGLLAGMLPFAAAHFAVNGFSPGIYLTKSAGLGFEWRLLPMRWVTLALDARPLLPEGTGLLEAMPWLAPAVGGILFLTLLTRRASSAPWRLVASVTVLVWITYLCYRDLQPYGLWRFYNLHYFKWTFPFLTLAALQVIVASFQKAWRWKAAGALAASLLVLLWRPVAQPVGRQAASIHSGGDMDVTLDLSSVDRAAFVPIMGDWWAIYFRYSTLSDGSLLFRNTRDFKLQPVPGGALLQPLRPLPAPPLLFRFGPETSLAPGHDIIGVTERLQPGIPCGILPQLRGCRTLDYR